MRIYPIESIKDYEYALKNLDTLWDADYPSDSYDNFEILAELINHYEGKTYDIEFPHPIDALQYYMAEHSYTLAELDAILDNRGEDILSCHQALSLNDIRGLCQTWDIPAEYLIRPYALVNN